MNAIEAIREFAEKLKQKAETEYYYCSETSTEIQYKTIDVEDIDETLIEFEQKLILKK